MLDPTLHKKGVSLIIRQKLVLSTSQVVKSFQAGWLLVHKSIPTWQVQIFPNYLFHTF